MKILLFTLCLWLTVSWLYAQEQADPKIFTGNTALQEKPLDPGNSNGAQIYLQIGSPIPYSYEEAVDGTSFNIRFPWDIAYIPLTFSEDNFEVSKGYYSDKVKLNWEIQSNGAKIDQIKVFRREFMNEEENEYALLGTLSSDSYTFEDGDTQGGVLYEYKVEAVGVSSIPKQYVTHITGVGYRNPTGVISGNVSFDGGSPVKDVVVRADPQGGDLAFGSSILFSATSQLSIPLKNEELDDAITLQAWVKIDENSAASLFNLQDNQRTTDEVEVSYTKSPNYFELKVEHTTEGSRTFTIGDYYPTGNVDGRGDDLFNTFTDPDKPITDFAKNFVHVSIVLENGEAPIFYLNGRNIDETYLVSLPEETIAKPSISTSGNYVFTGFQTSDVIVADGLSGNIDEVRLWNKALEEKQIRTDFKRYLGGSETHLIAYIRCDEKAGEYAYDISKVGVEFNKNHARIINGTWINDKPSSSQLGILGVTDSLGNYIISAIPFSGSGESYTITPMYGVHQFEPGQQLVFIGNGSEVTNQINFKDISAFNFLGRVYYTSNGIFEAVDTVENATYLGESGYNEYDVIIDGRQQLVSKGTHFYDASEPSNPILVETPKIYVEGANVYIDGDIVLDKNKRPVVTGADGSFNIKVPIGEHYVEVRKDKHTFAHAGRYPAAREDGDDLSEFFEHRESAITFLDTTRVSLVGRVVGGVVEAEKPIGFGYDGLLQETYNKGTDVEETINISSINNIGMANVTMEYLPPGGNPGEEIKTTFLTNSETGEYKVDLLPISYTINVENGIRIPSNTGIKLLEGNETVNLSIVPDTISSQYIDPMGTAIFSDPYHFEKSFTLRSVPVLNVVSQSSDLEVIVNKDDENGNKQEVSISTEGFEHPVYTQGVSYAILFETFEEYINRDAGEGNEIFDRVPIVDGEFNITNNLALPDSESITVDDNNPNVSKYIFRGGIPAIAPPFSRTIDIRYRVDGKDYDAQNYKKEGIILGGQSDGSQTFVTEAPDMPNIILRDPPGSNSFASIEKGQSISFTEEGSFSIGQSAALSTKFMLGTKFIVGGGVAGPILEAETVNSINTGLSLSVESAHGESITKTYTFNETISTSDDPDFVGSDADLYIGSTSNYYHGTYDNVEPNNQAPEGEPFIELKNSSQESVFIRKKKAYYFSEEPTETFFIFSQKYILETLIPELEGIIRNIESGDLTEEPPLSKSQYEENVRSWKKIIQDNEQTKYATLYDRENYKNRIKEGLENEIEDLNDHLTAIAVIGSTNPLIGAQSVTEAITTIESKKDNLEKKLTLLESNFVDNISFDAGVGEYTKSSEITIAKQKSRRINLDFDASLEASLGFNLNETGVLVNTSNKLNSSINSALTEDSTGTTIITYTLKDNDRGNFLSVDVINAFDGNGPIFSTVGGRTSCPYEGIDTTLFYNDQEFKSDPKYLEFLGLEDPGNIYSGGEQISYATQKVEVPGISVETASVTDVPEERKAEFTLILENNSVAEADANFLLKVDNTTNPNNAIFNIEQNGTVVNVPYGKKVEYSLTLEKSISDVYEYSEIDIVLASLCDSDMINDKVTVSAVFRPSCTAVAIDSPLENWVFNAGDAYNADNTTNPMNIAMFGYDRSFDSFERFRLEYRKSTSSSWTRLQTYYNTQELLDEAKVAGEDQGTLIPENTTSFSWDIGALRLADGIYELRVVSNCSNGTEFVSDVITGTVDLNVPVQFGTPSPTDGILGAGEDLRLQFSEPVSYSSALSKIEIKGETNQQEINHNVSVRFQGAANTMVIEKPNIVDGDFSLEFWLLNQSITSAVLFEQANGLKVTVNNGVLEWTHGGKSLSKAIATDGSFHHYTLSYSEANDRLSIYQDDQDLGSLENAGIGLVENDNSLVVGGNTFVGNLHDLRFWSKPLTLSEAYAAQFNELTGVERDLVGYWPMNEGNGNIANDLARFKHAQLNAEWDIKPKGTAYDFKDGQYLILDDVDFVQITDLMDVTLSFWMKTDNPQKATLFSNGLGNGEDLIQANGKANKWAVTIDNGILYLHSEGKQYKLSSSNLADNSWHHVAIVLRRIGTLQTFIDANQQSSNPMKEIGGMSGNKFWIGARGFTNSLNIDMVDEVFTGKIDELRLWNMARSTEQIKRDRFNEVDFNAIGLMLYARMNPPDPLTGSGPSYYHAAANETVLPSIAQLSSGDVSYTEDAPKITLERPYLSFEVSHVINGDEMIITPLVSDWSVLEGQILDITVDRMFDEYGNRQSSPVTWSAFVRRNEVTWFVEDGSQTLKIEKQAGEPYDFEVTLLNKGGKQQPYSIENLPTWLKTDKAAGTLDPNSSKIVKFHVDPELTIGEYSLDLFLNTDFNFDEKIFIDLRVLDVGPDWKIDPASFEYNMNIIGKVRIDGSFSQDEYSKVAAFVGKEIRGVANLAYDENFNEYFIYLSVYSDIPTGENITFKIWDATSGQVFTSLINDEPNISFIKNEVIGYKSAPAIFESTGAIEQTLDLSSGWTWISMYVEDPDVQNLNTLTSSLLLEDNDLIKSQTDFDIYDSQSGWNGSLSNDGGLSSDAMHKVRLAHQNSLNLTGTALDISTWKANINIGWNWLAYPLSKNVSINDALALLTAEEGDVIKNQAGFAIYDPFIGWSGTLNYLESGEGYMLKSSKDQEFSYPLIYKAKSGDPGRSLSNIENTYSEIPGYQLYENNMNIVAEIVSEDFFDTVLVVDDQGVMRGKSHVTTIAGRRLSFLTVFGNAESDKPLFVTLGNKNSREKTSVTFSFTPDALLGTVNEPLIIGTKESKTRIFPNPFSEILILELKAGNDQQTQVVITDLRGKAVYKKTIQLISGENSLSIDPNILAGVYFLTLKVDDQKQVWKIIKK